MIKGMEEAELTDSISHNFMAQMIPHHMAAIEMSENILKYSAYVPVRNIASGIIAEQTKSIADMKAILEHCSMMENGEQELKPILYAIITSQQEGVCKMECLLKQCHLI